MSTFFGGQGVLPTLGGASSNTISLAAGEVWIIPSGWWELKPGGYTVLQEYDAVTGIWRSIGGGSLTGGALERFRSDGVNYRLANQTGCVVGAIVTTAGSSYTTVPTVTFGAGGAVAKAIIGGAINTSITVTAGGSGYSYPPQVIIPPPPAGGICASAHCTLSAGAVASVVVDNQGAGYNAAPTIGFANDPREGLNGVGTGSGAAATASLTGSGTITGVVVLDHGSPVTSVPSVTFGSGSAAATAVMCWTITAYVVSATTAGSGYTTPVIISAYETPISGSVLTNPNIGNALVKRRNAFIVGALSAGAITATGQTVIDGGIYDQVPTTYIQSQGVFGANPVQGVFLSPTMGGITDVSLIFPG